MANQSYADRLAAEREIYSGRIEVHDLPPIFHYWSNKYVRPMLEQFGFSSPDDGFFQYLRSQFERATSPRTTPLRFLSIGSGNCDVEIALAARLRDCGHSAFRLECLDINPAMLERGAAAAQQAGVGEHVAFIGEDFNDWEPREPASYNAIIANQSLHHVVQLEHLFDSVKAALAPGGTFVMSELIGRNGHLRWPEALTAVKRFWRMLPPSYRFNPALDRYEEMFEDWDCSVEGFEGVRSQDIVPLLLERFHFQLFIGFANVVDPFVDRVFGWHFDVNEAWDRTFIDRLHAYDEEELAAGRIKPTHLFAAVANTAETQTRFRGGLSPQFAVRHPEWQPPVDIATPDEGPYQSGSNQRGSYEWGAWPHGPEREIEIAYGRLQRFAQERNAAHRWALDLRTELQSRVADSQRLQEELARAQERGFGLESQLQERTAWALRLDAEVREQAAHLRAEIDRFERDRAALRETVEDRTAWALMLDGRIAEVSVKVRELQEEFAERTAWALELDQRWHQEIQLRTEMEQRLEVYGTRPVKALGLFVRALARGAKRMLAAAPR